MRLRVLLSILAAQIVASIATSPSRAQSVTLIRSFETGKGITYPLGPPAQGTDGALYSFTNLAVPGWFKEQTDGAGRLLYSCDCVGTPASPLLLATNRNWYGTTGNTITFDGGTLYELTPEGAYTTLHNFPVGLVGAESVGSPIEVNGNLYGTTLGGRDIRPSVYRYDLSSGTFATLRQFNTTLFTGSAGALLQASDGYLYGSGSGSDNCGAVFKMTVSGTLLAIYSFGCTLNIGSGASPLVEGNDGNFYGTSAGSGGNGAVFRMDQKGNASLLHEFGSFDDEGSPRGGLAIATDGALYGTTLNGPGGWGTIYKISPDSNYQQLYIWSNLDWAPSGLLQHTDGKLYGYVEASRGQRGAGGFYSLDVGLSPFITFVLPFGKVGRTAQILGQGLTGATSVTFNGTATSFKVLSDTYMVAAVPSGATTGPVVVTTPSGPLTSNKNFVVR